MRVRRISSNGRLTDVASRRMSVIVALTNISEYNATNAWNMSFSDGNMNNNNNNRKYNSNRGLAVAAYGDFQSFLIDIWKAYDDCLKGKRTSPQAIEYVPHALSDVYLLAVQVWYHSYRPSTSTCFMVVFPKLREVFAAAFRDRIIHHWICIRLLPLFEKVSINLGNVSHACRKGFGTRTAIDLVESAMVRTTNHYKEKAWIYKGDIVGFFMHIDKHVMWEMLKELIETKYFGWDKDLLFELTKITIYHCPEKDCFIKSPIKYWSQIDPDKSLFFIPDHLGMAIGNLTTQLFAGLLLSKLDKYVIDRLKEYYGEDYLYASSYTRSVDDFIIVSKDKKFLLQLIKDINVFVKEQLHLDIHTDKVYVQEVNHGVKFLGKILKPCRKYIIKRTVARMFRRLDGCLHECATRRLTSTDCMRWQAVFNSYMGFLTCVKSYKIKKHFVDKLTDCFYRYFYITDNIKVSINKEYKYAV